MHIYAVISAFYLGVYGVRYQISEKKKTFLQLCKKMSKNVQKLGQTLNLPDFWTIFIIFAQSFFALKFNTRLLTHPNDMQKKCHKDFNTG